MSRTNAEHQQQIEVVVSGPDGANRLFILTGIAPVFLQASNNVPQRDTFTFLVGPTLTRRQFIRATATASIVRFNFFGTGPGSTNGNIDFVETDWDDESGQAEVRVEVVVLANTFTVELTGLGYQATVLAEL